MLLHACLALRKFHCVPIREALDWVPCECPYIAATGGVLSTCAPLWCTAKRLVRRW